jgi:hypothetical protein
MFVREAIAGCAILAVIGAAAPRARADGRLLGDDTFVVGSTGDTAIDAGLVVGFPSALPTGMSTGIGAGLTRGWGSALAWGVRASWSSATESTTSWTVTQWDLRVRATAELRHHAGRGVIGLRLGVGPTVVREIRERAQGMRAGVTGSALETTAIDTLPAADLDAVVALHVAGPWLLQLSGGPSIDLLDGHLRGGWSAELGVAWQP